MEDRKHVFIFIIIFFCPQVRLEFSNPNGGKRYEFNYWATEKPLSIELATEVG